MSILRRLEEWANANGIDLELSSSISLNGWCSSEARETVEKVHGWPEGVVNRNVIGISFWHGETKALHNTFINIKRTMGDFDKDEDSSMLESPHHLLPGEDRTDTGTQRLIKITWHGAYNCTVEKKTNCEFVGWGEDQQD